MKKRQAMDDDIIVDPGVICLPALWPHEQCEYDNNMRDGDRVIRLDPVLPCVELFKVPAGHPAYGDHASLGVRATSFIRAGTVIGYYAGELIRKPGKGARSAYDMNVNAKTKTLLTIDAARMGNEVRFINDYRNVDSTPNVYMAIALDDVRQPVHASRHIQAQEELLLDYGVEYWETRVDKTQRVCDACQLIKPLTHDHYNRAGRGWRTTCTECLTTSDDDIVAVKKEKTTHDVLETTDLKSLLAITTQVGVALEDVHVQVYSQLMQSLRKDAADMAADNDDEDVEEADEQSNDDNAPVIRMHPTAGTLAAMDVLRKLLNVKNPRKAWISVKKRCPDLMKHVTRERSRGGNLEFITSDGFAILIANIRSRTNHDTLDALRTGDAHVFFQQLVKESLSFAVLEDDDAEPVCKQCGSDGPFYSSQLKNHDRSCVLCTRKRVKENRLSSPAHMLAHSWYSSLRRRGLQPTDMVEKARRIVAKWGTASVISGESDVSKLRIVAFFHDADIQQTAWNGIIVSVSEARHLKWSCSTEADAHAMFPAAVREQMAEVRAEHDNE